MYTTAALLDIHARTHACLAKLIAHVATLPPEAWTRASRGFSYPTLVSQLHHVIGAERYWMGVMQGALRVEDDAAAHESPDALEVLRAEVAEETRAYLQSLDDDRAGTPTTITKWNGDRADIAPAHAVLRTQTHAFQHHGEIATMLRQLGHAFPPMMDFPLV